MYSCYSFYSILECYNLFSGFKFSIKLFCFISGKIIVDFQTQGVPLLNQNNSGNI